MTVIRLVVICCDYDDRYHCDEESPPAVNLLAARRAAKRLGWHVGRRLDLPDFCPHHAAAPTPADRRES